MLALFFAIQLGILPLGDVYMYQVYTSAQIENTYYAILKTELRYRGFYLGGDVKTYMWKFSNHITFTPYQSNYGITTGWRNKHIDIGAEYHCIHPTVPYYFFYHPRYKWEAFYLDVFVKIKGEVKIWQ